MKYFIQSDTRKVTRAVLREQLKQHRIPFVMAGPGRVDLRRKIAPGRMRALRAALRRYGLDLLDDPRVGLVRRIREEIADLVNRDKPWPRSNLSVYLAERLHHSYGHLSNVFSEEAFLSIEHYVILLRVERVKQLILEGQWTLTEIAWRLRYSSVAHLSSQFKKTTGLTPTRFRRIMRRRAQEAPTGPGG